MPTISPTTPAHCTPKRGGKAISLPVLPSEPAAKGHGRNAWQSGNTKIKHSRVGKWRAMVLILVYLAMATHIILWKLYGRTVSPVEPSESMETLREGAINAGFVFFGVTILSTLILGRFFCGWACHIVALQDLCSWMMMKVGIKPKPFRSRLMIWVPLLLALYMFVLPVAHRLVIRPLTMDAAGRMPAWLGQSDPLPGITTRFMVDNFWETFAPWYWAIPFILICTFGAVYFLGSKGFCTYGCPYGGFFAPADLVAVGKIRVTDACEHCGHCTAVCTSNVRVHEEVRDFGMVVDPGCMKCMDCISVCPNEALYFGFGAPTVLAKPKNAAAKKTREEAKKLRAARFDLTWRQEVAIAVLFLVYFQCYRAMFNAVPMLMAVGMAGIMAFCSWKLWTLRPVKLGGIANSRLQNWQLRYRGRIRPVGWLLIAGTVVMMGAAAWGGAVRLTLLRATTAFEELRTPVDVALAPQYQATAAEAESARRVIELYTAAGPIGKVDPLGAEGVSAFGWETSPDAELSLSYAHLIVGEPDKALARLDRIIEHGHPLDSLMGQAAQIIQAQEVSRAKNEKEYAAAAARVQARVLGLYGRALELHPELDGVRTHIAESALQTSNDAVGARTAVETIMAPALNAAPPRARVLLSMARLELALGKEAGIDKAVALVERAAATEPIDDPETLLSAAGLLVQIGATPGAKDRATALRDRAAALAEQAIAQAGRTGQMEVSAAGLFAGLGRADRAVDLAAQGAAKARKLGPHTAQWQTLHAAGLVMARLGRHDTALGLIREAMTPLERSMGKGHSAWSLYRIGNTLMEMGSQPGGGGGGGYLADGVRALELARDDAPGAGAIRYALAVAYYAMERRQDAAREMTHAATISDRNVFLARRLSELFADMQRGEESARWEEIAAERERMAR